MNTRDYKILHLDTNYSNGTAHLLQFFLYISVTVGFSKMSIKCTVEHVLVTTSIKQ